MSRCSLLCPGASPSGSELVEKPLACADTGLVAGPRRAGAEATFDVPDRDSVMFNYLGHYRADGTSQQEIVPDFFQPSRSSHVLGWYTTSGSYVAGPRHRKGSSPYSAQPVNVAALENQSIVHPDTGARRSS